MKALLTSIITILLLSSCVSSSKYNDLKFRMNIKNNRIEQLEEEVSRLKEEKDELDYIIAELQETVEELKSEMDEMKDAMREAHDKYFSYGPTDFFTESAISRLYYYY